MYILFVVYICIYYKFKVLITLNNQSLGLNPKEEKAKLQISHTKFLT